jgi:hypothetical protein
MSERDSSHLELVYSNHPNPHVALRRNLLALGWDDAGIDRLLELVGPLRPLESNSQPGAHAARLQNEATLAADRLMHTDGDTGRVARRKAPKPPSP